MTATARGWAVIDADNFIDVTSIAKITAQAMGLKGVNFKYTGGQGGWKGDVPVVRFDLEKIHALGWRAQRGSAAAVTQAVDAMLDSGRREI